MTPSPDRNANRIAFLDVARGIGILFVLLGHNLWSESRASAAIFSFHMPLFYFLSGLFFSPKTARTWKTIRMKTASILFPAAFFTLLACVVFLVKPELAAHASPRLLYKLFVHGEPWFDKPLWFFTSLAGVVFVFSFASRLLSAPHQTIRRTAFLALCVALSFAAASAPLSFRAMWSPAMLATIPFGLCWYGLGFFAKDRILRFESFRGRSIPLLLLAILLALPILCAADVSMKPDLRTARMGSWLLFPLSLCGIAAVLAAAKALPERIGRPIAYLGRNSAAIFALEFVTFPFVAKALGALVPGYSHFVIAESTPHWQSLAAIAAQLAVLSLLSPPVMAVLSLLWKRLSPAKDPRVGPAAPPHGACDQEPSRPRPA